MPFARACVSMLKHDFSSKDIKNIQKMEKTEIIFVPLHRRNLQTATARDGWGGF